MVAHLTLVAAVAIDKEKVVAADNGFCLRRGRAVDIAVFAENVVIAYLQIGGLTLVLKILSFESDDGEGEELVALAERGWATKYYVVVQHAALTEFYMRAYHTVGPYYYIIRQFGGRIYYCSRMNLSHNCILTPSPLLLK
jgi:hypothetical protein